MSGLLSPNHFQTFQINPVTVEVGTCL